MDRMNILIALKTPIPIIPLGTLKKVEFHGGLMSIFSVTGIDRDYMGSSCLQPHFIAHTLKRVRQKVRQSAVDTDL